MKFLHGITSMAFIFVSVMTNGQSFKQGDAVLNIFTINDTLKYFEFYTPEFPHGDIECGILKKVDSIVYSVDYIDNPDFKPFNLSISPDTVSIQELADTGYLAFSFKGSFKKFMSFPDQIAPKFYLNYETLYRAKSNLAISSYEYPSFAAKSKSIFFKSGAVIEEKWGVGKYPSYPDYHSIKNKTWIAAVYHNKFVGWLLLSDVESKFKKIAGINY